MNEEVQEDPSSNSEKKSLLEIALQNDTSAMLGSKIFLMEKTINEQIEKEEEERRLQKILKLKEEKEKEEKRLKEEKEKEETMRLKMEEDIRKKQAKDKLDRFMALKSLDEMVISIHNSILFMTFI